MSSFIRVGDLAIQAEQSRVLQRESGRQSRLLQRVENVLLHAAAHRECCGHEAPTQQQRERPAARPVTQNGGWMDATARGGDGERVAESLTCARRQHLLPLVPFLLRPTDTFLCLVAGRSGPSVNTVGAPPTKRLKTL